MIVPADWMQPVKMQRIVFHWTAGGNNVSEIDREHYHIIIAGDGHLVRGDHDISDNVRTGDGDYAAHTLGCNTGAIGVSLAGMAGAVEVPFDAGKFPINIHQFDVAAHVGADLCKFYNIKPDRQHALSHAEVQTTLGIRQRGKWDIARLPWDKSVVGAHVVGDMLRSKIVEYME